ncbi:phosphotransferase enzyme family protein [Phaeosphaeriaceae sp. PMI808]|nr:phosphotransferase enzyme family protein [Phaeosphaeriaceae sp. PMI808]
MKSNLGFANNRYSSLILLHRSCQFATLRSLKRATLCCAFTRSFWSSNCYGMKKPNTTLKDLGDGLDNFHRFTSWRWLWKEREQLAMRYIKFDLQELCRLAASSIGSDFCTEAVKFGEGQFNKVFLLTMNDGKEVVAKLPNPNAGQPHFATASEVATMNFLRSAHLPIPQIYTWNSSLVNNSVGAEYIIMEKQPGIILDDLWDDMQGSQKAEVLKHVVAIEKELASMKFTKFGGLYYKSDLPQSGSTDPLYIDGNGAKVYSDEFGIGPTNHRSFFDFGTGTLDIDRGPWSTLEEYVAAVAYREIARVEEGLIYTRMPEGLFYGPRQYQPRARTKISALRNYLKVAADVLPEEKATHAANISVCPLFLQVARPGFLDFNGPIPEDLGVVSLPTNFDILSPDEQRKAKALQQAQTLHNIYMVRCYKESPHVFQAMQQKDSLRHQVTVVPGTVLMDYEPYLNHLLREVEERWPKIVGRGFDGRPSKPCPLHFSAAEIEQQEKNEELWAQGVELMNKFIADVGGFKHWDGRVSNEEYETMRDQLASGIQQFLDREARNTEERNEWLKVLSFFDHE